MSVIWYKVWFDLWHNKLRTTLVILSITVGVFAVGATFGLAVQLLPAMDAAHRETMPSHATLYLAQPADRDTIINLRKVHGVEDVEALNEVEVHYKIHPGEEWRKGTILMRDNYERQIYDILQLKGGDWPEGEVLGIERMHAPHYGIEIGDQLIIKVDEQEMSYPVTGMIRHPFVPPPSMYDWAYFFGDEVIMEQFGIPRSRFGQIKLRVTPYDADYSRVVASAVKERLAKQDIGVYATLYQDPNKHWGRAFVDGMAIVIQILAVLAMILSVVLVLNTLTATITQQVNQIGIMKAVGGNSYTVIKTYLIGVLFIGLLSLSISLPMGTLASFYLSRWFLGFYNIDHDRFVFNPNLAVLQVLAAVAVPLLAALWPVLQGAAITVREAIASYGLGGDFGSNWVDRAVERIGSRFMSSSNTMALTNTFRRKGRLLLTQLVLVIAGVMFLMVMSLWSSLITTIDTELARHNHELTFYFEDLQRVERATTLAESVEGVEKAGMWLVIPVNILREGQKTLDAGMGSQLQSVTVDDPMYVPHIVEGRWLESGDGRAVVMNKQTADDEHIQLGDTVNLDLGEWGQVEWKVVGFYRVFAMFGGGYNADTIYAPRQAVFQAAKKFGKGGILLAGTEWQEKDDLARIVEKLKDLFRENHMEVSRTETLPELRTIWENTFSMVVGMLLVLAFIVAVVGGIGLMGSLWISVIERTKEIGIMRAVGARSTNIIAMFLLEGLVQGLLSWLIALPLSLAFSPLVANAMGQAMFQDRLDYQFNASAALIWLVVVLLISILAAVVPALNASRLNIRQSLVYE